MEYSQHLGMHLYDVSQDGLVGYKKIKNVAPLSF